jgi:hypothetical protein
MRRDPHQRVRIFFHTCVSVLLLPRRCLVSFISGLAEERINAHLDAESDSRVDRPIKLGDDDRAFASPTSGEARQRILTPGSFATLLFRVNNQK